MSLKANSYKLAEEQFKPIPVSLIKKHSIIFSIRCLFDIQLKTIAHFLRLHLAHVTDDILDIGAGNSPWKSFLPKNFKYVGLDINYAHKFNMNQNQDIIYYQGGIFPFTENQFSNALCVEVLEHVFDTETFVSEIYRCLKPNGKLILTVPWSARRHHLPHDYFRFTPEALALLFKKQGFIDIEIFERGNDYTTIFNKILCVMLGFFFPKRKIKLIYTIPFGIIFLPSFLLFFIAAHLTMELKCESRMDPLGYSLIARKPKFY